MTASFFMLFDSFLLFSRYHGYLWTSGDLLKPSPPTQIHSPGAPLHSGKMLPNDLDSSLANLVGSEYKMCKFSLHIFPVNQSCCVSLSTDAMFIFVLFLLPDLQFGGTPAKKWVGLPYIKSRAAGRRLLSDLSRCSMIFASSVHLQMHVLDRVCFCASGQSSSGVSW